MQQRGWIKRVVPALIFMILAACISQFDPYAFDYTRIEPKREDVVGTYVLVSQTLNDIPISRLQAQDGSGSYVHKLILNADGTFSVLNFPVWVNHGQWSISTFKSGSGKWNIDIVGGVREWSKVVSVWGLRFSSADVPIERATLAGEKPPYSIFFGYGDPDSGNVMIYERENSKSSEQ